MNVVSRDQSPTMSDRTAVDSIIDQTLAAVLDNLIICSCKWQVYSRAQGSRTEYRTLSDIRSSYGEGYVGKAGMSGVRSPLPRLQPTYSIFRKPCNRS
jgi:hypothetical protein